MRIPLASFCQLSIILSSASSAASEYRVKNGPELSAKMDRFPSISYKIMNLKRTG